MRILICPDKFAGTLTAAQAAQAIAEGWHDINQDDILVQIPLADGGPGMIDAIASRLTGTTHHIATYDPLGRPVQARYLQVGDTAYIESAQTCGLHLIAESERKILEATSFGLGVVMSAAIESGCRTLVVGIGGTATNDAGAGMLTALGLTPLDATGAALPYGGGYLANCTTLDGYPRLRDVNIIAAVDVDTPLHGINGATSIFARQKGANDNDIQILDHALATFATVMINDIPNCPSDLAQLPGAGAGGGIGAALYALGATRESGSALIRKICGVDSELEHANLAITGEGRFDHQSLRGKVVSGVASAAMSVGVPCTVMAGQVTVGDREAAAAGIDRMYSITEYFRSETKAKTSAADGLRQLSTKLARRWRRG